MMRLNPPPYSASITYAFEVLAVVRKWDTRCQILFQAEMIDEFDWAQAQWWKYDAEVVADMVCNAALRANELANKNEERIRSNGR